MQLAASQKLKQELQDFHGGLHAAMDAYLRAENPKEGERILRQLDQRMVWIIQNIEVFKPV